MLTSMINNGQKRLSLFRYAPKQLSELELNQPGNSNLTVGMYARSLFVLNCFLLTKFQFGLKDFHNFRIVYV